MFIEYSIISFVWKPHQGPSEAHKKLRLISCMSTVGLFINFILQNDIPKESF